MYTYNPKLIILAWAGINFQAFTDDMIEVTPEQTDWDLTIGAQGKVVRSLNPATAAKMAVSLQAEGPENAQLSSRRLLDRQTMLGAGPVSLTNINSPLSLVSGPSAYIEGPPVIAWKRGVEARVWTLVIPECFIFQGGAVV